MLIDSKYSYKFYSTSLNKEKYDTLKNIAIKIKTFKNDLSLHIHKNLDEYIDLTKIDFIKLFNTQITGLVGQDIQNAISHVYTSYSNKFQEINKKLLFQIQKEIKIEKYKVNGKNYKKGDTKNFQIIKHKTPLSNCLTYLSKYGKETTLEYIKEKLLVEKDENKIKFYNNILYYCQKFGFEKLLKIALFKKEVVFKKYNKKPIEFKSLTYQTTIQANNEILGYNKNYNSIIKSFIILDGIVDFSDNNNKKIQKTKKIYIPIKYSKKHHGNIKTFLQKTKNVSYTLCFDEFESNRVIIILSKDGQRNISSDGDKIIGVDVNIKHNLFSLSNDKIIDFDRDILNDYIKFLKHLDNKKTIKENQIF